MRTRQRSIDTKMKNNDLIGTKKELDENTLIRLLNFYWSKESFGYPIHEDVRVPSGVAE